MHHLRQRLIRPLGAVALLWLTCATAQAVDQDNRFAIDGAGLATCERFVTASTEHSKTEFLLFAGWVDGYVTGYNRLSPDTYDYTTWQTTEYLLKNLVSYCQKSPETQFFQAMDAMMRTLHPTRLQARSPVVKYEHADGTTLMYAETIEQARNSLVERGFLIAGASLDREGLASALRRFQADEGLPASGTLDPQTLHALLRPAPAARAEP